MATDRSQRRMGGAILADACCVNKCSSHKVPVDTGFRSSGEVLTQTVKGKARGYTMLPCQMQLLPMDKVESRRRLLRQVGLRQQYGKAGWATTCIVPLYVTASPIVTYAAAAAACRLIKAPFRVFYELWRSLTNGNKRLNSKTCGFYHSDQTQISSVSILLPNLSEVFVPGFRAIIKHVHRRWSGEFSWEKQKKRERGKADL